LEVFVLGFLFVSKMVDWLELIFFLDSVLWTFFVWSYPVKDNWIGWVKELLIVVVWVIIDWFVKTEPTKESILLLFLKSIIITQINFNIF